MQNIINKPHPKLPDHYSQDLRDLIDCLLVKTPEKRPSINEMLSNYHFVTEKHHKFLELIKTLEPYCKSDRDPKINKLNNPFTLSRNEDISLKSGNKSSYFSSHEKNSFELNESKGSIGKGYESTPCKKMNDSISVITNSTVDSFTKMKSNYLSNSEANKSSKFFNNEETKTRKASMGFMNQSHLHTPIAEIEFFESEKQIHMNPIRKSVANKTPFVSSGMIQTGKAPIKIIKQKLPPHLELKENPNIQKLKLNRSKDSINSDNIKQENYSPNEGNGNKGNIKIMLNFLKEKIGEKLFEQLFSVIDFTTEEHIMKTMAENDEIIKKILGNFYIQVVSLITHIIKNANNVVQTPQSKPTKKEEDNSQLLEDNMDFVRVHKKHFSVGSKSAFASKKF